MRNLKRIFVGVFILLLVLAVLAFVLENQQSVSLLFLGLSGPQLPVSLIVVLALLVGMLMGPVLPSPYVAVTLMSFKKLPGRGKPGVPPCWPNGSPAIGVSAKFQYGTPFAST